MNGPLPIDLQRRWGHLPDIRQRGSNEWSAACPQCGGAHGARRDPSDRFRMFAGDGATGARGWCRQCHYFAFADDDQQRPNPDQIRVATAERLKLVEAENRRIKDKLQRIADADFWKRWHDDMEPKHRELWHKQGIIDDFIEYYKLGYCANHTTFYNGLEWHSPTMTIPHYGPGWKLVNIQHRLLNPPEPGDKYRQMSGVPSAMFLTEPDTPLTGGVLVVEGAKKAIVTYTHIDPNLDLTVIAVPSKTPSADMLEMLDNAEPVYLALDPDAYNGHVQNIGLKLGDRVRFVHLPAKIDDLFVLYGLEGKDLNKYIKRATVTA